MPHIEAISRDWALEPRGTFWAGTRHIRPPVHLASPVSLLLPPFGQKPGVTEHRNHDEPAHGAWHSPCPPRTRLLTAAWQLSKDDEVAAGDEVEVRREDQEKINKFSRLHQREEALQEELKLKNVRPRDPSPLSPSSSP